MTAARVELSEANAFIASVHRHHKPVVGHRFSVGAKSGGKLVGVAVVGRPVARMTDQKHIAEVTRLATDGTKNACSFLYGRCARIAEQLGFESIQTFVLETEPATSLRASGWAFAGLTDGGDHNREGRVRRRDQPECPKQKWIKILNEPNR